jgi:hypothetical protein
MSNLWSGQPVTIRLDDLEVICEVLGCEPGDLLVREPGKARRDQPAGDDARAAAAGGGPVIRRRHAGRPARPCERAGRTGGRPAAAPARGPAAQL